MSFPLLKTKLYIPPVRPVLVSRPRLTERLNAGLDRKLTLISAPAGFGKTMLASEWIEQSGTPATWLSLDEGDNDLVGFLTYLIAALQTLDLDTAGTDIGAEALSVLQSPQPPPAELILTALINEIAETSNGFILVLDDYHLIQAQPIHKALTFLLTHMPPQMHLIITTRSDPFFLPLSRLRARGQMIDIRADDLRFLPQETATFLNQAMALGLSNDQVATLENRTEGWIAGLHLAALALQGTLSMQGGKDSTSFISAFTGDDRYIGDYLVDEVLAQRPKGTKDFLLQTSILDRMTGPLCDAVTGQEGGKKVLQGLEQANLFIVPLDNRRRWYRYHHLFADLLRQRLDESTHPEEIKSLHRRAGQWYEENDFLVEAVEHGLAAEDYEDVIRLIDEGAVELFTHSQMNFLLKWHARLPQELLASRPDLCMMFVWVWVATGHPEQAEHGLQMIEQTLGAGMDDLFTAGEVEGMPPAILGALIEIAVVRAQLAIGRGDVAEAFKLAHLVLPHLQDDEGPYLYNTPKESRMVISFTMGIVQKFSGDLGAAEMTLSNAAALGQERGNVQIVAVASGHLASVQASRGRLRRAVQTCQRGLQLLQEMTSRRTPMSGMLRTELGNLLFEQNDLEAALHHLQEGIAMAKRWSYWDTLVPGYTGLARVKVAQGDMDGAFAALDELAALGQNNPQDVMPAVESFRARLWSAQGQVDRARRWAETAGLDADSEINPFREGEFVILARVLIAQKAWGKAAGLIDRLLDSAETGQRWRHVVELLVLQALVLGAQGKQDQALESLGRALTLAEPEGYVRTFVDEGEPMAALLRRVASREIAPDYIRQLLAAFGPDPLPSPLPAATTLIEPLSERELEVLRLLNTDLSGPEIAREMMIALSTLRTHTQNIYGKLGVCSRMQAVAQAKELGLI